MGRYILEESRDTDIKAVLLFKNPNPQSLLPAPICPSLLGLIWLSKLRCGPWLTYKLPSHFFFSSSFFFPGQFLLRCPCCLHLKQHPFFISLVCSLTVSWSTSIAFGSLSFLGKTNFFGPPVPAFFCSPPFLCPKILCALFQLLWNRVALVYQSSNFFRGSSQNHKWKSTFSSQREECPGIGPQWPQILQGRTVIGEVWTWRCVRQHCPPFSNFS